jgi:Ser/Thr protein kinase RdoA (MazF antagonist)
LAHEAMIMEHVRAAGFLVPRVEELVAGDTELVMQRLEGRSMMDVILRRPWRLWAMAETLALLHAKLGAIDAPMWLKQFADGGSKVVHLDLHPLNVVMTAEGPYVIDWTNAVRGLPETDVASTWVIVRSSEIPASRVAAAFAARGRSSFVGAFLRRCDRDAALNALPLVIANRLTDRNLTRGERTFLLRWSERLSSRGAAEVTD